MLRVRGRSSESRGASTIELAIALTVLTGTLLAIFLPGAMFDKWQRRYRIWRIKLALTNVGVPGPASATVTTDAQGLVLPDARGLNSTAGSSTPPWPQLVNWVTSIQFATGMPAQQFKIYVGTVSVTKTDQSVCLPGPVTITTSSLALEGCRTVNSSAAAVDCSGGLDSVLGANGASSARQIATWAGCSVNPPGAPQVVYVNFARAVDNDGNELATPVVIKAQPSSGSDVLDLMNGVR